VFVFATVPGRSPPQSLKSRGPGTRADANPGICSTPTGRHRNTVPTAVAELQWGNIEICVGALGHDGIINHSSIKASSVWRSFWPRGSHVPLDAPCPSASIAMLGPMA